MALVGGKRGWRPKSADDSALSPRGKVLETFSWGLKGHPREVGGGKFYWAYLGDSRVKYIVLPQVLKTPDFRSQALNMQTSGIFGSSQTVDALTWVFPPPSRVDRDHRNDTPFLRLQIPL